MAGRDLLIFSQCVFDVVSTSGRTTLPSSGISSVVDEGQIIEELISYLVSENEILQGWQQQARVGVWIL